ncbi:hypothetical protein JCM5353_007053 [Sporobolomyces roseus]
MSIQAINSASVHSLTSGQVVIDLQTAVKELVENALDAGATSIDVKFKEHGIDSIEVQDNGKGIDQADWAGIALKHHTSKLASFADLAQVSTLGFRGEALSSLCGTAHLSLVTSTASTAPAGTSLTFARNGECIVGGKVARSKGTTIKVEKLFESLPVRRKELIKNTKREFAKALELLQAYALISTGVRFEVKNTTKNKTMTHLQSPASASLRSNFSSVFAPKSLQTMTELDLTLEVAADKSVLRWTEGSTDGTTEVKVKGLISKPTAGNGRTSGSRQFFYINGRPFHPTKIAKAMNEVYKSFVNGSFPTVVADFQLATDAYDVNVSPDKRTIFLHSEGNLISALKVALTEFFQPSQSTFEMTQIGDKDKSKGESQGKDSRPSSEADADADGDQVKERPSKRRKLETTGDEEQGKEADETADQSTSQAGDAALDESMDVEIDAGLFAARHPSQDFNLPPEFQLTADDPEQSFELPTPPSPIRRAVSAGNTSSPPPNIRSSSSLPPSPARNGDINPIPSTSQTSPGLDDASPHASHSKDLPLFRSSPSPTPALEDEPFLPRSPPQAQSAPRSPTPPPRQPVIANKLRQPQLSFGATASSDVNAGKKDRKGKGKDNGLKSMRNLLQNFIRPGGAAPSQRGNDYENDVASEEEGGDMLDSSEDERAPSEETKSKSRQQGELDATMQDLEEDELQEMVAETEEKRDVPEAEEDEGDIEIVEDSYQAASPQAEQNEKEESEDELEILASSCACVHGSPLDAADNSENRQVRRDPSPPPIHFDLPFGAAPAEIAGTFVAANTTLEFDMASLESIWSSSMTPPLAREEREDQGRLDEPTEIEGAGVDEADDAAVATLSRVVSKEDFEAMEIVGQFNLGFIIARRKVNNDDNETGDLHDDLFIIDQHASDEKYNFEKLQAETIIQSQRLLAPRVLNLPSHDEITAIEHIDLLRLNGYDVVVDEDADVGERVKLLAQPVSNKTVFDIADFEELLDLIGNRGGTEVVRPSKTRKMFASRACRKSVMIGKALNSKQMSLIVQHMGGMDQPWACPHGRPTMRWLAGLGGVPAVDKRANLSSILKAYDLEDSFDTVTTM